MSTQDARRVLVSGLFHHKEITTSSPDEKDPLFTPSDDKVYRHPTFYDIPDDVEHMCHGRRLVKRRQARLYKEEALKEYFYF